MNAMSAALVLGTVFSRNVSAQSPRHFPVSPRQVAQALSLRNIHVRVEQISLVADIVAGTSEPKLNIQSIQAIDSVPGSRPQSRVQLACAGTATCIPFFAVITWDSEVDPQQLAVRQYTPAATVAKPGIRANASATLQIDTGKMHIRLPVITLGAGLIGATIRATSEDHKRSFTATVVTSTLLQGSL